MKPEVPLGSREDEAGKVPERLGGQTLKPECTIYVYLCTGEVRAIPHSGTISIDQDLLCVCGNDTRPRATFHREDVYFCSRCGNVPAPPLC